MILGLLLGLSGAGWLAVAARDDQLAPALPGPWLTVGLGVLVLVFGWLLRVVSPPFTSGLATGLLPGAVYGAIALASDGLQQLAYAWCAVPIALGWLAFLAGTIDPRTRKRPWSVRRSTAPRIPRARTR